MITEYTTSIAAIGHQLPVAAVRPAATPWTERGVLLLNRVLSVQPGKPGSHRGKGWEAVTERAISALAARDVPMVAILWGRDARNLAPLLSGRAAGRVGAPQPHVG